jgi:hypothetical protein
MNEKLVNFMMNEDMYKELKMLSLRENKSIKEIINEQLEEYVKVHKEGNPQHTIDSFAMNEDFYGFPSIAINKIKKSEWINSERVKEKDLETLFWHVQEYKTELEKKGFRF